MELYFIFTEDNSWYFNNIYTITRYLFLGNNVLFFSCFVKGFPGGSEVKASAWNVGDPGSIPGLGRSLGEGNGNPLRYSCLENPRDRSLVGRHLWGHTESDTTDVT